MKKKILITLMILAIIFSGLVPKNVFAKSNDDLRSVTFSNWIRTLGSQYPLLESYGLVILKQPNLAVNNMSSLTNDQKIARRNVHEWLDEYSPKLIYVNENMYGLTQRVDQYYKSLYDLAGQINESEQAKSNFLNRFNRLENNFENTQFILERTSNDLNAYKNLILADAQSFSEKAEKAIESLNGENGEATKLRQQIKELLAEIQDELIKILNNPNEVYDFSFKFGQQLYDLVKTSGENKTIDVASVEAIGKEIMNARDFQTKESASTIQQKQQEVTALFKKLTDAERQATEVTVVEDQILGFAEMVKREVAVFDNLANNFATFNSLLTNLKQEVISGKIDNKELQNQLKYLQTIVHDMNKQTKQFEAFTTSIK
ncbi:HBL/NHE enterotoxin family protein [Virgibacillus sp. Bac330]|uniref:non-hemolytic enterotoxin subunit A n=1 Tax=Virgibacillus sp. Bac330 TaxID=2419841 RepID=UPI000EF4B4C3|nr:HBL/NHE enterotoxin family protein [Virgibacillus sp. Bac330]